jgi:hypothetical protein
MARIVNRGGTALPRGGTPDPREALAAVIDASRDSYAALSRMLDRHDGYLRRFVTDGIPVALRPDEHRRLADYFGLSQRALGIRDLWVGRG